MPAKGTKRAAPHAEAAAAKKALSGADARLKDVEKALGGAPGIAPQSLEVLKAALPFSLGAPKAERHRLQEQMVGMIGQVLTGFEATLQQAMDGEEAHVREVNAEMKHILVDAVEEAEAKLAERAGEQSLAAAALKESKAALQTARAALQEAEAARTERAGALAASEREVAEVEGALGRLAVIRNGSWDTIDEAKEQAKHVTKLGEKVNLENALINGLSAIAAKKPEFRGSFDEMVVKQFEDEFSKYIATLRETTAANTGLAETAAATVAECEAAVAKADAHFGEASTAASAADAAQREAQVATKQAHRSAKEAGPVLRKAEAKRDGAATRLSQFRDGPLAAFVELRGATETTPPQAEAEAKEGAATPPKKAQGGSVADDIAKMPTPMRTPRRSL